MDDDQTEDPKPCPFCGSEATMRGDGVLSWVVCDNCDAEGPLKATEEDALNAWNTRV